MRNLELNLAKLHDSLIASRNASSEYIALLIEQVSHAKRSDNDINATLQQIKAGSKIVDYASFYRDQEIIWIAIWEEASDILKTRSFS
jgi:hypothetical protein